MAHNVLNDENLMCDEQLQGSKEIRDLLEKEPTIGTKMVYCRLIIHFSKQKMADLMEIDIATLEKYEQDLEKPSVDFLYLYSFYFDIHMENFVDIYMDMPQFMLKYDVFHFAKFYTAYKYVKNNKTE